MPGRGLPQNPDAKRRWVSVIVAATTTGYSALTSFGGESLIQGSTIPFPSFQGGGKAKQLDRVRFGGVSNFASVGAGIAALRVDRGLATTQYFLGPGSAGDLTTGVSITGSPATRYRGPQRVTAPGFRPMVTIGVEDTGQAMCLGGFGFVEAKAPWHMQYVAGEVLHTGEVTPTPIVAVGGDTTFPFTTDDLDGIRQWGVALGYDGDQAADVAAGILLEGDGVVDTPQRLPGPLASSPAAAASGANVPTVIEEDDWYVTKAGTMSPSAVAGATAMDAAIGVVFGLQTAA